MAKKARAKKSRRRTRKFNKLSRKGSFPKVKGGKVVATVKKNLRPLGPLHDMFK